nr:MAG TPA: hypothetical protein [Caudoviricetes sp.]
MTEFDSVIDLALIDVNDYRLRKLYDKDIDGFKQYCDGFLIRAVQDFKDCRQSLTYDIETRTFESDLTQTEQKILAYLWAVHWYLKDNQTYALYRIHLQNSGSFKNHSEAQNLKENSVYADKMREEVDRQIRAYQLEDISSYY